MDETITFGVNGRRRTLTTDPRRTLLEVLREDFGLTGTKYGCGEARCGACSVLIDDRRALSCTIPLGSVSGASVITIEGLAAEGTLHPVQEAFLAEGAFQCGFCTPGMIMTTVALLRETPRPDDARILAAFEGNLCRCNGYVRILKAVKRAAAGGR